MKHHLLVPLASLAIIGCTSSVLATAPTPLYPRSGPVSCTFNGSTSQTLQPSTGSSQAAAPFTTTNAALDFYSAALTNSLALAATDSSDGTINLTNTGAASFTVNASVDFYDYNPASGVSTLIVPGAVATGQVVNGFQTKTIGFVNSANIGGTGHTVALGHMLKATIKLATTSGSAPTGALLFNTSSGQGFTFVRLPQNRSLTWPFGSFSIGANATITAPAAVCANSTGNIASVPADPGATYAWSITNGTITAGQGTAQITWSSAGSGPVNLGVTVAKGCAATSAATVAVMGNTSTAISSSANPSVAGQPVSFTATISPVAPASGTPSGTVQFQTNGVNFGAPVSLSGGSAVIPAIGLGIGNYAVSATYSGNANFCASSGSLAGGQEVDKAVSTATISSSVNPSLPGVSVSFTATVSMLSPCTNAPAGQVQFKVDGAPFGGPVSLSGGVASLSTSTLPPGSHVVTAEYCGASDCLGSTNTLTPNQLVDAPPVAGSHVLQTFENGSVTVTAASLLANDSDPDGDILSLSGVSATSAQGGTVSLGGGSLSYTPPTGYVGADSFTYTLSDTFGATATATVNVTVRGTNGTGLALSVLPDNTVQLSCTGGVPDRSYLLQATFDLLAGPWTTLSTNVAGADGAFLFIDTDAAAYPARFYRTAIP
ncbi:MAG TPA: Ig-like domain repeat protein [Candidatus Dormibacteraeota bacterium]|nr:Ig-like domain repeat protein [Candidatus Dormibacteraeota bacterium]